MDPKAYYQVLEISEKASLSDITKAYRTLAKKYHPDKNMQLEQKLKDENNRKFSLIKEAYETLSDPVRRKDYDLGINQDKIHQPIEASRNMRRPSAMLDEFFEWRTNDTGISPIPVSKEKLSSIWKKTSPQVIKFFSQACYQNLYTVTTQDVTGKNTDECFSDIFALVGKKSALYPDEPVSAGFLSSRMSLPICLEILGGFIKGRYYGKNLIAIQEYLESETKKPNINSEMNQLAKAILKLIQVRNISTGPIEAFDAITSIYDALYKRYISVQGQLKLLNSELKETNKILNEATASLHKKQINALEDPSEMIKMKNNEIKDILMHDEINLQNIAKLEEELGALEIKRYHYLDSTTLDVPNVEELKIKVDIESAKKKEIETKINELQPKLLDPTFLDIIESNSFKLTMATIVHNYWQDNACRIAQQPLNRTGYGLPRSKYKEITALIDIIIHADDNQRKMTQPNLTSTELVELANYYFDLEATSSVLSIKLNAALALGLCFQLASQAEFKSRNVPLEIIERVTLEEFALDAYQKALKLSKKSPPPLSLYITMNVTKLISEFVYEHRKKPSSIETLILCIVETMHLMSHFPSYCAPSHFLEHHSKMQFFCLLTQKSLERLSARKNDSRQVNLNPMTLMSSCKRLLLYLLGITPMSTTTILPSQARSRPQNCQII